MTSQKDPLNRNGKSLEAAQSQWLEVELKPAIENREARQVSLKPEQPAVPSRPRFLEGVSEEDIASQERMTRRATVLGGMLVVGIGLLVLMAFVMIMVTFLSRIL